MRPAPSPSRAYRKGSAVAENCPACGGPLSRCVGCGKALPRTGPRPTQHCSKACKDKARLARYTQLRELGYTIGEAQRGRCAKRYSKMIEAKQCDTASDPQETPGSES